MSVVPPADVERLLTFEVESAVYALPIAEVHEVSESSRICCVPTISRSVVGVMNWHGDALPVVATPLLLDGSDADVDVAEEPEDPAEATDVDAVPKPAGALLESHVLVVSSRADQAPQLGIPIDRVIGLVDGSRQHWAGGRLIVERRPVEGRVVSVLDPRRLVERATEVIGRVA